MVISGESVQGASATDIDFKEDVLLENHSANIATESNFAEGLDLHLQFFF